MEAGGAYPSDLPSSVALCWPTLTALKELGGSGTIQEIMETVATNEGLSEDQQALMQPDGVQTQLYQRLANARTYLKAAEALEQSRRGVWAITERGREMAETDMEGITGPYQRNLARARQEEAPSEAEVQAQEAAEDSSLDTDVPEEWRESLLQVLLSMKPEAFERLALRLLREAGFTNTQVTARGADGGIDGSGVYGLSLVSFPVFFQCKRYAGSVGAPVVRDFRGAMAGRGDKGLLITTGTYTTEARREATRAGAPPVDLIDRDRLCDLLKEYGLGLSVEVETVESVTVNPGFFEDV